ncbi:uncharacterized protein LOC124308374 isoform X2 [Neodiprion virginianus]|uniref:uncharacterized protein LOC124308374 isoform X2 n=1 Tax=Neodiprion virginianus TaxID=2961670 RepID=UPI001EE74750|nr:uncharacterized protein LOC124308374 isoform X2 [Neodiprion virginianus]
MVRQCCICKAESSIHVDISLHRLPKDEATKQQWFLNIGREVKNCSAVCSQHFNDDDFEYKIYGDNVRRYLKATAVPCLSRTEIDSENVGSLKIEHTMSCHGESVVLPLPNSDIIWPSMLIKSEDLSDAEEFSQEGDQNSECSTFLNPGISADESHSDQNFTKLINAENLMDIDNNHNSEETANTENQQKYTASIGATIKRTLDESHATVGRKRIFNARYVGDLQRKDFTSDISWNIFKNYMENTRRKQKMLTQKVRRFKLKIENLQTLLEHVKEIGHLSNEGCKALDKLF